MQLHKRGRSKDTLKEKASHVEDERGAALENVAQQRTKRKTQISDTDHALKLAEIVPTLRTLLSELNTFKDSQDSIAYNEKNTQIKELASDVSKLSVCTVCWTEAPSPKARRLGVGRWLHIEHAYVCPYCGKDSKRDGSTKQFEDARNSIRRRLRVEVPFFNISQYHTLMHSWYFTRRVQDDLQLL